MEQNVITRKVVIINSRTQSQKVIQDSRATTLGELKAEARERGIDFEGMTWFEGHMRAELKDDAAPLPTNIPYKGQVVNDLTFMLTAPEKKVRSGVMSRAEAYNEIKRLGLQDECKRKFGKNFTQCATADLIALVEKASAKGTKPDAPKVEEPVEAPIAEPENATEAPVQSTGDYNCAKALTVLIESLYNSDIIEEEIYDKVIAILNGGTYKAPEKMSKKEIDDMFNFVHR